MITRHPLLNAAPFADFSQLINNALGSFENIYQKVQADYQLYSTKEGWALKIDVPGVEKEDIQIQFEDDALQITAKSEEFEVNKKFVLGKDVDLERIEARFENGVLELKLPKTNTKKSITIL